MECFDDVACNGHVDSCLSSTDAKTLTIPKICQLQYDDIAIKAVKGRAQ